MQHHAFVVFDGTQKKHVVGIRAIVLLVATKHVEMVETLQLQPYASCHGIVHVLADKHTVQVKGLIHIETYRIVDVLEKR